MPNEELCLSSRMRLLIFLVWLNKNILASYLTALKILPGIRHLLHNFALLIA
jgi:hypothetical protein